MAITYTTNLSLAKPPEGHTDWADDINTNWDTLDAIFDAGSDTFVKIAGDTMTGNLTLADDTWIGLGAAKGRIVFDDTPATDTITVTSALLGGTNLTFTGTGTFNNLKIEGGIPILVFKDNTDTGDSARGYQEWRDSNNVRLGFFGNHSYQNDDLMWKNESSGGHLLLETTGTGNVGIGTANPGAKLHLNSIASVTGEDILILENDMNNANEYIGQLFKTAGGLNYGAIRTYVGETGNSYMSFLTTTDAGVNLVQQMTIQHDGNVGIGTNAPTGQLHVDQSSAPGAKPVLRLDQGDIDDTFIDYIGTSAADGTRSISSDTTEEGAKFGAIRCEINGVTKWIRVYDDHS